MLTLTNLGVPEGTPEQYASLLLALHNVTGDAKSKKAAKSRSVATQAAGECLGFDNVEVALKWNTSSRSRDAQLKEI